MVRLLALKTVKIRRKLFMYSNSSQNRGNDIVRQIIILDIEI